MNPYGPALVTLNDWNATLARCVCCEMPGCAEPTWECQSVTGSAEGSDNADTQYELDLAEWIENGETGPEPTPPEGHDDWTYGQAYAPFQDPGGAADDPLPVMYRRSRYRIEYEGTEGDYIHTYIAPYPGPEGEEPGDSCLWQEVVWTMEEEQPSITILSGAGAWWDDGMGDSGSTGSVTPLEPIGTPIIGHTEDWVAEENDCEVTATLWIPENSAYTLNYGTPVTAPSGVASSWPITGLGETVTWAVDMRRSDNAMTLSDAISEGGLILMAKGNIPGWDSEEVGSGCAAEVMSSWPTIGEHYVGDPEAWPTCEDLPIVTAALATATKARRRWIVPNDHLGTYYHVMWDVIEEPEGWDATINDPEVTPPDPLPEGWTHPQIPDPEAPARSFYSQNNEWEWTGEPYDPESPEDESRKSEWFEIDAPSVAGVRRVVNIRYRCYNGPYGSLPELFGDQVTLE